jgi:hypothetical protein
VLIILLLQVVEPVAVVLAAAIKAAVVLVDLERQRHFL